MSNNSDLQTFAFDGLTVAIIDHNGEGWLTGDDIGKALEYSQPRDSIQNIFERNREVLEEYSVTIKLMATDGKQYDTRVYNEEGVIIIGFLSKQPKAIAFQKSAAKILKAYRHNTLPVQDSHAQQLMTTKDQLIDALQAQLTAQSYAHGAYKEKVSAYINHLTTQNAQLNRFADTKKEFQQADRMRLNRAIRAQSPIKDAEALEIAELFEQGQNVKQLSHWFYRSPAIIRRAIRQAGGVL